MTNPSADLKGLKEELDRLRSQVTRFGIASLTVLLALFLAISQAYRQVQNTEAKLAKVAELSRATGELPGVPEEFLLPAIQQTFERTDLTYFEMIKLLKERTKLNEQEKEALKAKLNDQEREALETKSADQKKEALKTKHQLEDELRVIAAEKLNVDFAILGSKLSFNLLRWILLLPFVFIVSAAYLSILLSKLKLVHRLANQRLEIANRDDVTMVDALQFSSRTKNLPPYSRYPFQLQAALYVVCLLCFLIYLCYVVWSLNQGLLLPVVLTPQAAFNALALILSAIFYSFVYAHHVSRKLDFQRLALIGGTARSSQLDALWKRLNKAARRVAQKLPPRISLPSGSLMIVLTLALVVASTSSSCHGAGKPRTGYELLAKKAGRARDAYWYSATIRQHPLDAGVPNNRLHKIGRSLYLLSLVLAGITFLFVVTSIVFDNLRRKQRLASALARLCGFVALFLTADFAFNIAFFSHSLFPLKIVYWLTPVVLWWGTAIVNGRRARRLWLRARKILVVLYVPIVLNALLFLVWGLKIGLIVYFLGVQLITLGYLQLARGYDPKLWEAWRYRTSEFGSPRFLEQSLRTEGADEEIQQGK